MRPAQDWLGSYNYQLLDEVEQNRFVGGEKINYLICDKKLICEQPTNHDILRVPVSIIALSFYYKVSYKTL